jgi:hypothetical protein
LHEAPEVESIQREFRALRFLFQLYLALDPSDFGSNRRALKVVLWDRSESLNRGFHAFDSLDDFGQFADKLNPELGFCFSLL